MFRYISVELNLVYKDSPTEKEASFQQGASISKHEGRKRLIKGGKAG